jgi:hypothetical protein
MRRSLTTLTRSLAVSGVLSLAAGSVAGADVVGLGPTCSGTNSRNILEFDPGKVYFIAFTSLSVWCADSPSFAGGGFFAGTPGLSVFMGQHAFPGNVTLPPETTFRLYAIDIADAFFGNNVSGPLTFTGTLLGGGTVSQTFFFSPPAGAPVYTRFFFSEDFAAITSASFPVQGALGGNTPAIQFNTVQFSQTPEPASLWLVASGLLGFVVFRRARRKVR